MTEQTVPTWDDLRAQYGSNLVFAACEEHLWMALAAIDGKVAKVIHLDEPNPHRSCIEGHAPAMWLFFELGHSTWVPSWTTAR